jgi:signal transduction histidine kinase
VRLRERNRRSAALAALAVCGVALCGVAVVAVAANSAADSRLERALTEALIVGVPMAGGLLALRNPGTVRFGVLLTGAGAIWSLTALAESSDSLPYSVGRVSAWLIFPVLIYLMLAFPDGRLTHGVDRNLFGGVALLIALLYIGSALFVEAYPTQTPWATCGADCPSNAFLLLDGEPAVMDSFVTPVREIIGILLLLGVTWSLIARRRAALPLRRRVLTPMVVAGAASSVILCAFLIVRRIDPDGPAADTLGQLWAFTVPAVAAGFYVGLDRRRAIVSEVIARVSVALGQRLDRAQLRATLAAALEDPSIDVLVPDEHPGRWRGVDGRSTSLSSLGASGRAVMTVSDETGLVAALAHDPLLDDEELLASVRAPVLATVHHERLVHRLAGSLDELEVSRKRIARAADLERSRIERDLHDGAQQRLIGLRIKLSVAEDLARSDPGAGIEAMRELGDEVEVALDELRSLAHGVYPAVLSDRGLADALRSWLGTAPVVVRLSLRGVTRHPAEIETAVYYTCMEAVQNAIKHAVSGGGVWITLRQDEALFFEVRDEGVGFEPLAGESNGGLRNMRDRIEAVGGRLIIDTAPGRGTRVRGTVPV